MVLFRKEIKELVSIQFLSLKLVSGLATMSPPKAMMTRPPCVFLSFGMAL